MTSAETHITIRTAKPEDVNNIFILIQELAIFEKALHEVTNTPEQLLADGFGENPLFSCLIAEIENEVVGMSFYYFRYSTWKGKRLYLEDLIVKENYRNRQIGRLLLEATMQESLTTNCSGMVWQVLDWNEPAIKFYQKYQAAFDGEWLNVSLNKQQIVDFFEN
ncbi:MAG: GNAT family N-acetyltransferase [Verrucomicrobia bacterium]|nr:GNAT family N-acetyltransferase [Cytophagales bacterium]